MRLVEVGVLVSGWRADVQAIRRPSPRQPGQHADEVHEVQKWHREEEFTLKNISLESHLQNIFQSLHYKGAICFLLLFKGTTLQNSVIVF